MVPSQPIILVVLSVIIVGIAVVIGINMYGAAGSEASPTSNLIIIEDSLSIQQILSKYRSAKLSFNIPDSMWLEKSYQIVLLVSTGMAGELLVSHLISQIGKTHEVGSLYTDSVRVSTKLEAHLNGQDFSITPITSIQQVIFEDKPTKWEWIVTPRKSGSKTLFLTLNAFCFFQEQEITQTIETYRRPIIVHVKMTSRIIKWISKLAGVLITAITMIFVAYFTYILGTKKKEKKGEKKIIISP